RDFHVTGVQTCALPIFALLGRCRPRNAQAEALRLQRAWSSGEKCAPRWSYEPVPDLSELRRVLVALSDRFRAPSEVRALLGERVQELVLESHVVEAIGRGETLRRLARTRFDQSPGYLAQADALAHAWKKLLPDEGHAITSSLSDDDKDP